MPCLMELARWPGGLQLRGGRGGRREGGGEGGREVYCTHVLDKWNKTL